MSNFITEAFVKQYSSNVFHLSQQKGTRLMPAVRNELMNSEEQFFERVGLTDPIIKSGRHTDTPIVDTPHSRRRVTMNDFVLNDLVDRQDKIRTLINPENEYVQAFAKGFGRQKDRVLIAAASADAAAGKEGGTLVPLPNSQKIAAVAGGAGSNLNVDALRAAKRIFDENEVEDEDRFCAITAEQLQGLLEQTEVTSSDFNTVRALVMGEVNQFLGWKFIRLELLANQVGALAFDVTTGSVGAGGGDADGFKKALCWHKKALILATGMDVRGRIDERPDKNYSTQVFADMSIGAVRMEEESVLEILTVDT